MATFSLRPFGSHPRILTILPERELCTRGSLATCQFVIFILFDISKMLFSRLQAESYQNLCLKWAVVFNKPCVTKRSASFGPELQSKSAKKSKTKHRDLRLA